MTQKDIQRLRARLVQTGTSGKGKPMPGTEFEGQNCSRDFQTTNTVLEVAGKIRSSESDSHRASRRVRAKASLGQSRACIRRPRLALSNMLTQTQISPRVLCNFEEVRRN